MILSDIIIKQQCFLKYLPSDTDPSDGLSIGNDFGEGVGHEQGDWTGQGCGCGHREQSNGDGVGCRHWEQPNGDGVGCGHIQSVVDGVGWGEVCCCVYLKQSDDDGVGSWHLEQSVKVARFAVGFGIVVFIMMRHNVSSELGIGFSVIALALECLFKLFVSFVFWSGFIVVCFLPMKWK